MSSFEDNRSLVPLDTSSDQVSAMSDDVKWLPMPEPWTYGVMNDGRIFFINDDSKSTQWCHPKTGIPVQTGYTRNSELPCGWESGFTPEGHEFYVRYHSVPC